MKRLINILFLIIMCKSTVYAETSSPSVYENEEYDILAIDEEYKKLAKEVGDHKKLEVEMR